MRGGLGNMRGKQNKKKEYANSGDTHSIRKKAEDKLAKTSILPYEFNNKSTIEIIHELQVQQMELEMQTEELRSSQHALQESRDKYLDLYEFAPVGYFTLTKKGLITELNLTAAVLLGVERITVKNKGFGQYIATQDIPDWEQFFVEVRTSKEKKSCELELVRKDASHFFAKLEGITLSLQDASPVIRITVSDITQEFKAKNAQEESEKLYRSLIENMSEIIYSINMDGTVQYISPNITELMGFSQSDIIGSNYSSFIFPEDMNQVRVNLNYVLNGGTEIIDIRVADNKGKIRHFQVSGRPILKDDDVIGMQGIMRDVTEFKIAQENLQYKNFAIESSINAIAITNLSGELTDVNPAFLSTLGYQHKGEVIGLSILSFWQDQDTAQHVNERTRVDGNWLGELTGQRKDGTLIHVQLSVNLIRDQSGTPVGMMGSFIDITDRKKSDENLRETTEYLQKLLDYANAPIIIWDPNFRITRFNSAFEHLTGRTEDEVLGKSLDLLFPIDSSEVSMALIKKTFEGERWETVEIPIFNVDGSIKTVLWNSANILDPKGKIISTIAQGFNITMRKQTEEALYKALKEKEILLGEVHHRVKNNFAGVISLIDLQCGSTTNPIIIANFKDLEVRIRSMAIVHELLYVTKDFTQINLSTYMNELVRYLLQVYETTTQVQYKIDMGGFMMPIETIIPCGQVISEIITNSLKYAFPDTFSCKDKRGEPCSITISLQCEGNDYLLNVADNGIGMREAVDAPGSSSLGKFLIRFIVEHQLQGNLEINTKEGTVYTIRFPIRVS